MKIQIYNDDCFNIFPKLEVLKINMVLVDLPYGQTNCDWDIPIDLTKMWDHLKRICTEKCIYVFFTTTKYGINLINSNKKCFRYDIVWQKNMAVGFFNAKKMPMRTHEMIYVFYKKPGIYNPQMTIGKPYKGTQKERKYGIYGAAFTQNAIDNLGTRYPTSIVKFNNTFTHKHPTQKPLDLLKSLIQTFSNPGDTILDFTMGSGSTGVACMQTHRNFIGIEQDYDIYKISANRLIECELNIRAVTSNKNDDEKKR